MPHLYILSYTHTPQGHCILSTACITSFITGAIDIYSLSKLLTDMWESNPRPSYWKYDALNLTELISVIKIYVQKKSEPNKRFRFLKSIYVNIT